MPMSQKDLANISSSSNSMFLSGVRRGTGCRFGLYAIVKLLVLHDHTLRPQLIVILSNFHRCLYLGTSKGIRTPSGYLTMVSSRCATCNYCSIWKQKAIFMEAILSSSISSCTRNSIWYYLIAFIVMRIWKRCLPSKFLSFQ